MVAEMRPVYAGGYLKGGKVELDDRASFTTALAHVQDCRIQVRVGPPVRSDEAHNYYWLILGFIEEHGETGHTAEDFHEYFKVQFIPKRVAIADGNGEICDDIVVGGTTTKLNRHDFYDYVENVRQWARERLRLETPDPDPKLARRYRRRAEGATSGETLSAGEGDC